MVKSKINPEKVTYDENKEIEDDDLGEEQSVYSYVLFDKKIEIALGKQNYSKSSHNIIYYHIYLIVADSPVEKIGVFEVDSEQLINILDEDGDVDLNKGNVLFFSFLSKDHLIHLLKDTEQAVADKETGDIEKGINKEKEEEVIDLTKDEDSKNKEEEQGLTELKIPTQRISEDKKKRDSLLKDGLFIIDESKQPPEKLPEETKEEDERIKGEYREGPDTTWIEKYMENNNYGIGITATNGDCFFDAVRLAYEEIGHITTIDKLRAKAAEEVTQDNYDQYRTMYVNFLGEQQTLEKEMKDLKKMTATLKKNMENSANKEESKKIVAEANIHVDLFKKKKEQKEDTEELMEEFEFMKNIDTLDKLKEFMMKPDFWANAGTIATLEELLNMKVIILSEKIYNTGDEDAVLQCGEALDKDLEKEGNFNPDYYIMVTYSGDHYKLITYKDRGIFKFSEIPYAIKARIIKKCMERNAGSYYLIKDFRNMKTKLGLPADEGAPIDTDDNEGDLYDSEVVFMFHAKSACEPKAGKGSGEKIPTERLTEFTLLNKDKDKVCNNWRKKLDDSWITQFTVDNKRWASVEHYHLACQFKKGFPDFFNKFALTSESDISTDIEIAKAAASKSGLLNHKVLREKHIKPDEDYFEVKLDSPHEVARRKALEAKFTQNLDLKKLLLETKNAKLMHFIRGFPAKMDEDLMKLRKQLRGDT